MTLLSPDLSLGLTSTHVLITGGAGLIGSVVVSHFLATGSRVSSLDISYTSSSVPPHENCTVIPCDISSEPSIKTAFATAVEKNGPVEVCVALASLDLSVLKGTSFVDADFGQLKKVLDVNVAGTWLTSREWLRGLKKVREQGEDGGKKLRNVALVIIGSESGHFGERGWVDYSMGKSAVQGGLLMSLRAEVGRVWEGARVNVVAPGPVDTERWKEECTARPEQYWEEAQATVAMGKPVPLDAVAKAIVFLASENMSGHVHGQIINVDGGKQGKVMWNKDDLA